MIPYDTVEKLIDKYGVADVLHMVTDVIGEKMEHIESSYGDELLAAKWGKAGTIIRRAIRDLPKVPGIK